MNAETKSSPHKFLEKYYYLITIFDLLFSAIIVCPGVVTYWRSIWSLMDIYVFPENIYASAAVSWFIGIFGTWFLMIYHEVLENNFHPEKNAFVYYLVSRFYTMCLGFICINSWRGPWELFDTLQDIESYESFIISTVIALGILIAFKGLSNCASSPCLILHDSVEGYFEVSTLFGVAKKKSKLFMLDCLFSTVIIITLVVVVWRGVWTFMDFYFENNGIPDFWSLVAGLEVFLTNFIFIQILGYPIILIVFLIQLFILKLSRKLSRIPKLCLQNVYVIIALIGTISVWRGIWEILDQYFLPDDLVLSNWITLSASVILLVGVGCSNSILARGVFRDEEPSENSFRLPCLYLRYFIAEKLKTFNNNIVVIEKTLEKQDSVASLATISTIVDKNDDIKIII